ACYEKLGRYASAWINFEEARARAVKAGQDNRVAIASERAEALEPRLSRLEILVPNPPEGLVVERDGVEAGAGQWGVALPIDGGPHAIVARAPGKKPWKTTVEAKPENDRVEVSIPELEDAPPEPEPIVPPTPAPADDTGLVAGAIVAGSLGVIGVGLGAAFGVLAMGKDSASLDHCPEPPNGCTAEGVDLRNQAFTFAHVSTTGFVVGGVGLAVGAVLLGVALSGDDEGGSDDDDGAALEAAWLPYVDLDGGGGVTARLSW
ncbi:MAG: hypothetical protein KC731_02320, partial [Myxococcales bacterium]|nr:hypothetical protein [Myxococcales bacterium]